MVSLSRAFRFFRFAYLLLAGTLLQAVKAQDGCSRLGRDLECSACSIFIEEFFNAVARAPSALFKEGSSTKNLWHDGDNKLTSAKVYEQRIREVYKAHAPKKLRRVYNLMKKYKGDEYNLYLRVCKKYEVSPEPEFQEPENDSDDEDKFSWKYKASEEAIEAVKALPKKEGMQWAVSGAEGKRKFSDFNKLMSSGGTMNNLSMGGHVADDLSGCVNHLADNFAEELSTVVFDSQKPFSSGLHKKFCKKHGYCGNKGKRKNDL
eukprot:g15431.t1